MAKPDRTPPANPAPRTSTAPSPTKPGQSHPASTNPGEDQLGTWRDDRFDFASPAAREAWHRSAYAQGIDPETWHLGEAVDSETERVIGLGLGGAHPPFFRGPDGQARFGNARTLERGAIRDIRRQHFAGKSPDEIEAAYWPGGLLPGADAAVSLMLGPKRPANDIEADSIQLAQAADTGSQSDAEPPVLPPAPAETEGEGVGGTELAFPGQSLAPGYKGEEKAMGPKAMEAIAAIPAMPRYDLWPVDALTDSDDKPILNPAWTSVGQGDGRYGMTRNGGAKAHGGYDIAAKEGAVVRAVRGGKVVRLVDHVAVGAADNNHDFGNEVIIDHGDGTFTQYAHLQMGGAAALKQNAQVKAGDVIGHVGKTGNLPDRAQPHLHFEIRYGNDGLRRKDRTTIHPGYLLPPH